MPLKTATPIAILPKVPPALPQRQLSTSLGPRLPPRQPTLPSSSPSTTTEAAVPLPKLTSTSSGPSSSGVEVAEPQSQSDGKPLLDAVPLRHDDGSDPVAHQDITTDTDTGTVVTINGGASELKRDHSPDPSSHGLSSTVVDIPVSPQRAPTPPQDAQPFNLNKFDTAVG